MTEPVDEAALAMLGGDVRLRPIRGRGRNSLVYCAERGGSRFALKQYLPDPDGREDRMSAEVAALELMRAAGVRDVPEVLEVDASRRCALYGWIDGDPVTELSERDIEPAARLLGEIDALRERADASTIPAAHEACPSGAEIVRQVERRLAVLRGLDGEPELSDFLSRVAAVWRDHVHAARGIIAGAGLDFDTDLGRDRLTLVPSDFGFHNALRRPDGSLAFVDFEYFGWDDPVKLTADFLLHPGHRLSPALREAARLRLGEVYGSDPTFDRRLDAYLALFAVRWILILLGEFVPSRWHHRVAAGNAESWDEAKRRQLAVARTFAAAELQVGDR